MTIPSHLTQSQAARRLGCSHTNVGRLIRHGQLTPLYCEGITMVPTDQVDKIKAEALERKAAKKAEPTA